MASIEASATNLVQQEISAVCSALRKNSRWNSSSSSSSSLFLDYHRRNLNADPYGIKHPKLTNGAKSATTASNEGIGPASFAALRVELYELQDISTLDAQILLHPFLNIVRSGDTSGPITAAALSSIDKFISYGLIHLESPNLGPALQELSSAGTHCKFEASDSVSDEVVLLKILDVLKNTLTSPLGKVLTDEAVCEMMETGLSMCCQMRLSEMLRRSAERTMQALVAAVFRKLQSIPTEAESRSQTLPSTSQLPIAETESLHMAAPDPTSGSIPAASTPTPPDDASQQGSIQTEKNKSLADDNQSQLPYGLPSIRELLRVLISLLDPYDNQHTDSMRLMALGIINIAFEIGGRSIGRFPSLRAMVADDLCKHLFQLARTENVAMLSATLRAITTIFDTNRQHLKLQQELFLAFIMDRLVAVPGKENELELDKQTWDSDLSTANIASSSTSGGLASSNGGSSNLNIPRRDSAASPAPSLKAREHQQHNPEGRALLMEHLCLFAREPEASIHLWVNYDCDQESEDLWERMVRFMARGVYPASPASQFTPDPSQILSLDALLSFVCFAIGNCASLVERMRTQETRQAEEATASKAAKNVMLKGALLFNEKPKKGLAFLEEEKLIYSDPSIPRAESLAKFLKDCPRLDKRELGDFISRPDQLELLKSFMQLFDFRDKVISDAMRDLLEAFRLPGEAQQIARITEIFAEVYHQAQPAGSEVKSQDAAYVLAYSVIMLNTDQHNPQNVKNKMKPEDYRRNLRGVNDGADFSQNYLNAIYDSIKKKEIVLPEEHQGQLGFEYAWRELLRRSRASTSFKTLSSSAVDRDIFAVAWKPIISAISYAFTHFKDDLVLQRAIGGFQQCAVLASGFDLPEVFDFTMLSLARITTLLPGAAPVDSAIFPKVEVAAAQGEPEKMIEITVSPLAIRFGTNTKAQIAAIALFSIAKSNGGALRSGWIQIFEIYQTLFVHSLLPPALLSMEDFLAGTSVIPMKPRDMPKPREDRRPDGGLLSTLSSYLLSPYGPAGADGIGRDLTDDDIENALSAVDCISSCRVEDLYRSIPTLPTEAIVSLLQSLVELAERLTTDRLGSRDFASSPSQPARHQLAYEPASVFLLELMVSIAGQSEESLNETWPIVYDYISRLLKAAASYSPLLTERAAVGLLRLAYRVAKQDAMRDQLFIALDLLRNLPQGVITSLAEQLTAGLTKIIVDNPKCLKTATEWNMVFALLATTAYRDQGAKLSFNLLLQLARGEIAGGLSAENFVGFIQTLNTYATAASIKDGKPDVRINEDSVVERGRQALDLIRESQVKTEELISNSKLPYHEAWEQYWLPVLSTYAQQCVNSKREIRQTALGHLQRTLIASELLSNPSVDLSVVFEKLIFPTLDELLKPQVFRRDPGGMGETRLRATALLCKLFLHCTTQRQGMSGLKEIWGRVLDALDRMMHSGRKDTMYEAIEQQLQNNILVMASQGILVPPTASQRTSEQAQLWDSTFTRIDTFLPHLQRELFPAESKTASNIVQFPRAPTTPSLGSSENTEDGMFPAPAAKSPRTRHHSQDQRDSQEIASAYV